MKIRNLNFQTWCRNHDDKHNAKWCREVYPWAVFIEINYGQEYLGLNQKIFLNGLVYTAKVISIETQDNGRYKTTFSITTTLTSERKKWEERSWDNEFQIVYSPEGEFITVFTKKEDPSKIFVSKFMMGNFNKIEENKSIPVSELLFKSLISYVAEEQYKNLSYLQKFELLPHGIRELPEHSQFKNKKMKFYPLYSAERELWITYCFNEEKAHRIAYYMASQCKHLIVVYCNPTYTRHHRCTYYDTEIISLYEFLNKVSPTAVNKFEPQIRFLQNHLNIHPVYSAEKFREEIMNPSLPEYKIQKVDVMEALGVMKMNISNEYDAFYFFAAMNLLNAWINRNKKKQDLSIKEEKLFRNMYYFKIYIKKEITNLIINNNPGVKLYIENNLVIVEILGFQFSFHNIPYNATILKYLMEGRNELIKWSGKRLQPIAPLILNYARIIKREYFIRYH